MSQESYSDGVYELEKTLSCPSCGKVQDLQTHAACGAAKCSSCWRQHSSCPCCRKRVEKSSFWDLGRILSVNAERSSEELGNVDAFEFLKVLQNYNDATTSKKENDNANKQKSDEQDDKNSSTKETENSLVDRNCFGGKAFYGGDQTGKTGRVGRRRLERHERNPSPEKQASFDDSMFDFHSQSSMPASQVACNSQVSMAAPSRDEHDESNVSQHEDERSQEVHERGSTANVNAERRGSTQAFQAGQQQESRSESSTCPGTTENSNENLHDESASHQEQTSGPQHERDEQQASQHNALLNSTHGDSQETRLESSAYRQTDTTSSENVNDTTTRDESKSQHEQGPNDTEQHSKDWPSGQASQGESGSVNDSMMNDGGSQQEHEVVEDTCIAEHQETSSRQSQHEGDVDSQETRLDSNDGPETTTFMQFDEDAMDDTDIMTDNLSSKPSKRRVTILQPAKEDEQRVKPSEATGVDYRSIVTPATSSRKRQRTKSPPPQQQSPSVDESDTANIEGLQARLDMAATGTEGSAAHRANETSSDVEGTSYLEDTQHSIDSICLPDTLDFHHAMPPPDVPRRLQSGPSTADGSFPHMQFGSQSSLPLSRGPRSCSTNVNSKIEREGNRSDECLVGGEDQAVQGHESRTEGATNESRESGLDHSEDTQETLLPSQELPSTCDFLRSFLPQNDIESTLSKPAPAERGDAVLASKEGGIDEDQASNDTRESTHQGSPSLSTPPIRPDLNIDSQTSLNSQLSIESRLLPSSVDFYNTTGMTLPPSVPIRSRSSHLDSSNTTEHMINSPQSFRGRPGSQSGGSAEPDETNLLAVLEPRIEKDDGSEDEAGTKNDDVEPVDRQLRKENIAKTASDKDIQRLDDPQQSLPSPSDSLLSPSDTQHTMMPSQCLPTTRDFLKSFHLPDPRNKGHSSDEKDKAPTTVAAAPTDRTVAERAPRDVEENNISVAQKCGRKRKEFGGSQLSRHSRSDSDSTDLEDTQNSLSSCMIPATQELGRFFQSNQQRQPSQSTFPTGVSFTIGGKQESVNGVSHRGDAVGNSGQKVAMQADINSSPEQETDWSNTDTQQTLIPSQCFPRAGDLHALFASPVAVGERAEARRDGEGTVDWKRKSLHVIDIEPRPTRGGCLEADGEKSDEFASQTSLCSQHEPASQASIASQHLPNTCDFGNMFRVQTSAASPEAPVSEETHETSPRPPRITLDLALEDNDLKRVERLRKSGVLVASDFNISSSTTHFLPYTRSECDPFSPKNSSSKSTQVCLPTFSYFQSLTLGVPVVDSAWLEKMEAAGKCPESKEATRCVWGDSGLHQKVLDLQNGSSHYEWLKSTAWWREKIGPCQLPLSTSTSMLDGCCILVPNQQYCRPLPNGATGSSHENSPGDLFDASKKDSAAVEEPEYFQHLTKYEMETLCHLLGAKVVHTADELDSSDVKLKRLALLPASMPPKHFPLFSEQRLSNAALMNKMHLENTLESKKIWALRSTWLTDSLSARHVAPLEEYSYGILMFLSDEPARDIAFDENSLCL